MSKLSDEVNRLLRRRSGGEYPRAEFPPVGREGIDMIHREDDDDEDDGSHDA